METPYRLHIYKFSPKSLVRLDFFHTTVPKILRNFPLIPTYIIRGEVSSQKLPKNTNRTLRTLSLSISSTSLTTFYLQTLYILDPLNIFTSIARIHFSLLSEDVQNSSASVVYVLLELGFSKPGQGYCGCASPCRGNRNPQFSRLGCFQSSHEQIHLFWRMRKETIFSTPRE